MAVAQPPPFITVTSARVNVNNAPAESGASAETTRSRAGGRLFSDPGLNALAHHIQGSAPLSSNLSWNSRTLKFSPERLLGVATQATETQLADLVRQRLARPGDVALQLGLDVVGASAEFSVKQRRACSMSQPSQ